AAHEVYVGVYYHRFEKYESAAARFATARARYPETPLYGEAGCRMGLSLEGLGKNDQARIAYEGILNLPPERFPKEPDLGLFERAWAYFRDPELLQYRTGEEFWKALARRRLKDLGSAGSPTAQAPQAQTGVAPPPAP
ncbi:MAG: hypothetical protein AB1405_18500, partial [Bdellovibrionota bacterium]